MWDFRSLCCIRGSFNRAVWSHPLFSMCSCINHVKSSHCRIEPAWSSVSVYVALFPPSWIQTFPHPEFVDPLLMLACFCRARTGTDWPRSPTAGSSSCTPPPPSPVFSHSIKRHLDMFTVLSDYIKPAEHRVRGLIMLVSYIRNNSADNAGCSKWTIRGQRAGFTS